ncbi:MAG: hypothetical protein WAL97_00800 [Halobacteriota archaeon]
MRSNLKLSVGSRVGAVPLVYEVTSQTRVLSLIAFTFAFASFGVVGFVIVVVTVVFRLNSRSRWEKERMGSRRFERPTFAVYRLVFRI